MTGYYAQSLLCNPLPVGAAAAAAVGRHAASVFVKELGGSGSMSGCQRSAQGKCAAFTSVGNVALCPHELHKSGKSKEDENEGFFSPNLESETNKDTAV